MLYPDELMVLRVVVAGVELRRDGIFSSRLAATALYTTSPSVAYLRIDLRIHHNGKSTQLYLPVVPLEMLSQTVKLFASSLMLLPVVRCEY